MFASIPVVVLVTSTEAKEDCILPLNFVRIGGGGDDFLSGPSDYCESLGLYSRELWF